MKSILYEVVGNGRKREKRYAPLYFIVGSFQIDKKSLKTSTQLI